MLLFISILSTATCGVQKPGVASSAPCTALDLGLDRYDDVKCIEIPVGREDEVIKHVTQTFVPFVP